MKKTYLALLITALLCVSAGCKSEVPAIDTAKTVDSSGSKTSEMQSDAKNIPEPEVTENEKTLTLEEVMSRIEGEYINSLFVEELKKTRSLVEASKYPESVAIRSEEGGFYTLIGNGHEGMTVGDVENLEYSDGKYIISFCGYEGNNLKIEYTPEKNSVYCESISDVESWSTDGKMIEFVKTSDRNGETPHLAKVLFEGISNVDILDDGVYAKVYEKNYKISVITDYMGEAAFNNYSGGLYLSCDDSGLIMRYKYENGKIHLYDTDDMLVKVFE